MSQAPKHTRRWYQFGIGTILVLVAAFAILFGWARFQLRERLAVRGRIEADGGHVVFATEYKRYATIDAPPKPASAWRRMLGDDVAVGVIIPHDSSDGLAEMAFAAFPEADLYRWSADKHQMELLKGKMLKHP